MLPLQDTKSTGGSFPFWVVVIVALNLYVFYLEFTARNIDVFISRFALIPALVDFSNPSTLLPFITNQFLHGGFIHILSNMWFLWVFGDNIEDRFGLFFFPIFYLAAGFLGNFLQYLLDPTINIPILGASGAIAGVLGAYYALFPHNKVKTLIFIFLFVTIVEIPASLMLFYWFVIQLFSGAVAISQFTQEGSGVAYFAHIGGFALGWIVGKLINYRGVH